MPPMLLADLGWSRGEERIRVPTFSLKTPKDQLSVCGHAIQYRIIADYSHFPSRN